MGMWFLATAISELLAGQLAALTRADRRAASCSTLLGGQADFYLVFVVAPLAAAFILLLFSPWLRRLMHGRDAMSAAPRISVLVAVLLSSAVASAKPPAPAVARKDDVVDPCTASTSPIPTAGSRTPTRPR